MLAKHWVKLAIMIVTGLVIAVMSCSEDPVEPVVVDIGGTLVVTHIPQAEGEAIVIDGIADAAWNDAKEFTYVVRDSFENIDIMRAKAITDSTYFYLLVEWKDPKRDVRPDMWEWYWEQRGTVEDPDSILRYSASGGQDFFLAIFDDGGNGDIKADCWQMCHYRDTLSAFSIMRNDGPGMVDAWVWRSGQTDTVFTLEDWHFASGDSITNDQRHPVSLDVWRPNIESEQNPTPDRMHVDTTAFDGDFLFFSQSTNWDVGPWIDDTTQGEWPAGWTIPGYVLADSVTHYPDESMYEIEAKGRHNASKQVWVLEIKRKLDTGFSDDIQIVLGEKIYCTLAYADHPAFNSADPHDAGTDVIEIQF